MKKGYEHEVEKPAMPKEGHMMSGMGMGEFKGQADSIAYGQAGIQGCKSDSAKIKSQMKNYSWE